VNSRPPLDGAQRERRAALTAQIERDETALKDLISSGETRAGQPSDELREIAERLPQLQAELRELERGAAGGSDSQSP
jgi:chromosome segregation ATPase